MASGKGDFALQMQKILDEYGKEASAAIEKSSVGVGAAAANKLKANSPRQTHHYRRYAEGWRWKKDKNGTVVYNATNWQLTHLLENGHVVKPSPTHPGKKDRVEGTKHIARVEEWANEEFENRVRRELER